MFTEMSRREFFKKAGVLSTALALSGCGGSRAEERLVPFLRAPEDEVAGVFTDYATLCRQCPAGCGVLVRTMGGRAHKLEGNPRHPLNQGRLCARGQAGLQALYDPDRLTGPMARVPGGDAFATTTWDEALGMLTEALSSAAGRPGAVRVIGGQIPDHAYGVASLLLTALEGRDPAGAGVTGPVVWNLHRAMDGVALLESAARSLYGSEAVPGLPFFDLASAEVAVSFSADLFGAWVSPVYFGRAFGEMRRGRGVTRGYLVQVEPRLTTSGVVADERLVVPPGGEGHVALCLGRVILDEGLGDAERASILGPMFAQVDARATAAALGLPFESIVRVARLLGASAAPLAIPGGGLGAVGPGSAAVRAVMALNLLVGADRSTLSLSPGLPLDGLPPRERVSTFAEVRALVDDLKSGAVDVLLVLDGDPLHDLPAALGFAEAAAQVKTIVDFSPFPTDTGGALAHLRLPAPTYLETWGYQVPQPGAGIAVLGAQQPVVRQLHDTRSPVDVLLAAAKGMGGDVADALPWENEVSLLKAVVDGLREVPDASITTGDTEVFWNRWQQYGGWWATTEDPAPPVPVAGSEPGLKDLLPATDALPAAGAVPGAGGAFVLRPFASVTMGDGRHANLSWMQETPDPLTSVMWDTWLEIAPAAAETLGIETGDLVTVTSSVGVVEAPAYVHRGVPPGMVAMPLGGGHADYGRHAAGRGVRVGDLLEPAATEDGELAWGETRVTVARTGRTKRLARLEGSESTVIPEGL